MEMPTVTLATEEETRGATYSGPRVFRRPAESDETINPAYGCRTSFDRVVVIRLVVFSFQFFF